MATGLIFGNLRTIFPGGVPESPFASECPPGQICDPRIQCFQAPCPCHCIPDTPSASGDGPEDFIRRESSGGLDNRGNGTIPADDRQISDLPPSVVRIVHPFGEDPVDFIRLAALIGAGWLVWNWYAKRNNHR